MKIKACAYKGMKSLVVEMGLIAIGELRLQSLH